MLLATEKIAQISRIRHMNLFYKRSAIGIILAFLCGCSDPIDEDISDLIESGGASEDAKMALNLAKGNAVAPLITAFQNKAYPAQARISLAEALYRLYIREKNEQILLVLIESLDDSSPPIRAAIARILGNIGERHLVGSLLTALEKEGEGIVQLEILKTLELMSVVPDGQDSNLDVKRVMDDDDIRRLTNRLSALSNETLSNSLELAVVEWLEAIADMMASEAQRSLLTGDLITAEEILQKARKLVPDSHNINYKIGKFHMETGNVEKGLNIIFGVGLAVYVERLEEKPVIDGHLDDSAWSVTKPIVAFYQLLYRMTAHPAKGKSEMYLGYFGQTLYIGVKGYEPTTETLRAEATKRDAGDVWRDDCVEIYIDVNRDSRTYYQLIVNSLGTLEDRYRGIDMGFSTEWNGDFETAAAVADTYWSMEIEIPASELHDSRLSSGDIWGFNIAQVRIGNISESAQWTPTYGWSQQPDRVGFLVFK